MFQAHLPNTSLVKLSWRASSLELIPILGLGSSKVHDDSSSAFIYLGACGLVWSMLVALGAIDPGSNPGRPTTSLPCIRSSTTDLATFKRTPPLELRVIARVWRGSSTQVAARFPSHFCIRSNWSRISVLGH